MAYKIYLSNKQEIPIDRDELESVQKGIESGARLIKVRSGMFNPAFIVLIDVDHKRMEGLKQIPKQLPDLFDRIGKMASIEDIIKIQLEAPPEVRVTPEEHRALVEKFRPKIT